MSASHPLRPRAAAWRARGLLTLLAVLAVVLLVEGLGALASQRLGPWFEREGNARLSGYVLQLGSARLRPWTLTLTFRDVVVRQLAHPEPAVLALPRMVIDVEWRALLRGRVVARALLDAPALVIDAEQLRSEARDPVPLARRGWQRLPELYPLEVNTLGIRDGTLVYRVVDAREPIRLTSIQGAAYNIRHVEAGDSSHPSPVHLEAVVFDRGRARFDGAADFLRHRRTAVRGRGAIDAVPLATLGPLLHDYPLRIEGGTLAAAGDVDLGDAGVRAHLAKVGIDDLHVDYLGGGDPREAEAVRQAAAAARRASRDPAVRLRIDELRLGGDFGFVNRDRSPAYRLFLDQAQVVALGFDNQDRDGRTSLRVRGRPMGSGRAWLRGEFRNGPGPADFALDLRADGTSLRALNPLLRAHANLDAAAGRVTLYSQLVVRDGRIRGYVKPLVEDAKIYDREQDADDGPLHRLYEWIADGVRSVLENRRRDTLGTVADLSGPVGDPQASTWQIIRNLARNAFVEALLPGFEGRAGRDRDAKPARDRAPADRKPRSDARDSRGRRDDGAGRAPPRG